MMHNIHEFDVNLLDDIALAEYEIGFDARVFGEPYQPDASPDWLRGWDAAADGVGSETKKAGQTKSRPEQNLADTTSGR